MKSEGIYDKNCQLESIIGNTKCVNDVGRGAAVDVVDFLNRK